MTYKGYQDKKQRKEYLKDYMQEYRDRLKQKVKDEYHARIQEKMTQTINTTIPQKEAELLRLLIGLIQEPSFKKYSEDEQTVHIQNELKGIDKGLTDMVSDIQLIFKQEVDQFDLEIDDILTASPDDVLKKAEAILPREEFEKRFQKAIEKTANIPVSLPFQNHGVS